jgi:NSS family neurotransmitter:Na+ symporter
MWRFSYLASEYGGAAFVLLYLAMTVFIGLPILLAEFVLGRGSRKSPLDALRHYGGNRWKPLGALFVTSGFLILAYYCVIAGWTVRYALVSAFYGFSGNPGEYFRNVSEGGDAIFWQILFLVGTIAVVASGVNRGIERVNFILMPALFAILVGLAIYATNLDGSGAGYEYYLRTDFSKVLSLDVLTQAGGQAFFSLSLGMGSMLTYASYLDQKQNLPNESLLITGADFGVAFVAGLVVFPMIFAFGLGEHVGGSTLGALFITLPEAFSQMGGVGRIVGLCFFVTLAFGALTSAVSLLEVVVASAMDTLRWSRTKAAIIAGAAAGLLGLPAAWKIDILDLMDQLAGNVFLLIGGLALAIFVGWVMNEPAQEAHKGAERSRWLSLWIFLLRVPVPIVLVVVLIGGVWTLIGKLSALLG